MSEKHLLDRIRGLGHLTPSEAKIAAFLEDNFTLTVFETISSVSEKAKVGKATVGRFLKRLGYTGFTEFMADIRQDVVDRLESPIDRYTGRREEMAAAGDDFLAQHVRYTIKNLEETLARNKPEQIKQAAKLMTGAKGRLYVLGAATSQALAHFFYLLAKYMSKRVQLLDVDMSTTPHELIDVSKDDVLLAIMYYRFSSYTVKIAQWFHSVGCPVILLADKEATPLSEVADIQLYARSAGPPLFNSRVAALLMLETLLMAMAPLLEDKMYQRFKVFEELRGEFGTFSVWPGLKTHPDAQHQTPSEDKTQDGRKRK